LYRGDCGLRALQRLKLRCQWLDRAARSDVRVVACPTLEPNSWDRDSLSARDARSRGLASRARKFWHGGRLQVRVPPSTLMDHNRMDGRARSNAWVGGFSSRGVGGPLSRAATVSRSRGPAPGYSRFRGTLPRIAGAEERDVDLGTVPPSIKLA